MAVGGFILFYTLLFTTNNINFESFCMFETRAKPGNPTSLTYLIFVNWESNIFRSIYRFAI